MKEKQCGDCRHFLQHYGLDGRRLFRIYCGHCIFLRTGNRRPDHKACEHFTPGNPDPDAFVTKEYLSKELLQYVLRLELLPEIEETRIFSKDR